MNFSSKKVLLTGGNGTLGSQIIQSKYFDHLLAPTKQRLDITQSASIDDYFFHNNFDIVIHCAALARMARCEENPIEAIRTNINGTSNLVSSIMKIEEKKEKKIRFIHISTDGVYSSKKGNYSEKSATIPYNNYGWSKLGAECAVRLLSDYVIIRTRFFNPFNILFDNSAIDIITSSIQLNELVEAIHFLLNSKFIGTVNVGSRKMSEFDRYKKHKPSLKPCNRNDIIKNLNYEIAKDATMDCNLWLTLKEKK